MKKVAWILAAVLAVVAAAEGWLLNRAWRLETRMSMPMKTFFDGGDIVSASGTWMSDTKIAGWMVQTSKITCERSHCLDVTAQMVSTGFDGALAAVATHYDIDTWNENAIVTKPVQNACTRYVMRIDRAQKELTTIRSTTSTEGTCSNYEAQPIRYYLSDGYAVRQKIQDE